MKGGFFNTLNNAMENMDSGGETKKCATCGNELTDKGLALENVSSLGVKNGDRDYYCGEDCLRFSE